MAAAIERIQEFARARQEREQRPKGGHVLDRQTPIPKFAERIKEIRIGDPQHPPAPANTMATLRIFAQERDVDELLQLWPASEETGGFAPLDAVAILTLAAVDRTPAKAAELTVGLRRAEQGGSGLTESIIHDLTAQRTVPDLAEFIAECKRRGQADLVEETLTAFVRSASRTSLDKALLYFELLRFQCDDEAKTLLFQTLSEEGARPSGVDLAAHQRPLAGVDRPGRHRGRAPPPEPVPADRRGVDRRADGGLGELEENRRTGREPARERAERRPAAG